MSNPLNPAVRLADESLVMDQEDVSYLYSDKRQLNGEERLMLSVLEDGIARFKFTYEHRNRSIWAQHEYRECHQWLASADCRYIYSFEYICQHFGFSPQALRAAIFRHSGHRLKAV